MAVRALVHVQVLVLPRRLEERLADRRIDALDAVVVAREQVDRGVDVASQEVGLLAVDIGIEVVLDLVEVGALSEGATDEVRVLLDDDARGRRGVEHERARGRDLDDVTGDRHRLRRGIGDRDRLEVMLRQDEGSQQAIEAGVRLAEGDRGGEAVRADFEGRDVLPAGRAGHEAGLRRIHVPFPRVLQVVQGQRRAVRPLETRAKLEVDLEAAVGRLADGAVREARHLGRELGLPVPARGGLPQAEHRRRQDLGRREGVVVVGVQVLDGLPVTDDGGATGGAFGRLVHDIEQDALRIVGILRGGRVRRRRSSAHPWLAGPDGAVVVVAPPHAATMIAALVRMPKSRFCIYCPPKRVGNPVSPTAPCRDRAAWI